MSEEVNTEEITVATEQAQAQIAMTAGQMIKEARLACGLHIGTLSMALKVPVKKLEALEANDWSVLPDMVFVRALATSVCKHIKIENAPVLAALPQLGHTDVPPSSEKTPLNQPFRTPNDVRFAWSKLPTSMPMLVGALALLLAAVVLLLLPNKAKENVTQIVEPIAPVMPPTSDSVTANKEMLSVAPSVPAPSVTVSATLPLAGAALRIASKGIVWIEVKDSKGSILVQRTMQPKEVANVSGQPPLAVVIGRINEIESISVRGKPMILDGLSPDNVARFEVK